MKTTKKLKRLGLWKKIKNKSLNQKKHKYEGKIGWCDKKILGLSRSHYVFIRKVKENGKCDVNTLTSLETKNGHFEAGKFPMLRDGTIYPIPKKDDSLKRFGGVDKRVIKNIPLSKIDGIGRNYIAKKHHYYIKKYLK